MNEFFPKPLQNTTAKREGAFPAVRMIGATSTRVYSNIMGNVSLPTQQTYKLFPDNIFLSSRLSCDSHTKSSRNECAPWHEFQQPRHSCPALKKLHHARSPVGAETHAASTYTLMSYSAKYLREKHNTSRGVRQVTVKHTAAVSGVTGHRSEGGGGNRSGATGCPSWRAVIVSAHPQRYGGLARVCSTIFVGGAWQSPHCWLTLSVKEKKSPKPLFLLESK